MGLRRRLSKVFSKKGKTGKSSHKLVPTHDSTDPSTLQDLGSYPSIWHAAIDQNRWTLLEKQLDNYRWDYESKKARKLKPLSYCSYSNIGGQRNKDPKALLAGPEPLTVDDLGQTPLHLAVQNNVNTPWNILKLLVVLENGALSKPDYSGRYVIHHAILGDRTDEELRLIVSGCPRALTALDRKGKSALALCIDTMSGEKLICPNRCSRDLSRCWGLNTEVHQRWQMTQDKNWRKIEFVLDLVVQEGLTISPKEHTKLILRALQAGAPATLVDKMIGACRRKKGGVFTENIGVCVRAANWIFHYNYPLSLLKTILIHTTQYQKDPPKEVIKVLRQGLMKHYQAGFEWKVPHQGKKHISIRDEIIQYYLKHRSLHESSENKKRIQELDSSCSGWLRMLEFLLVYTSTREFTSIQGHDLLHVALSIPACPPSILELIVIVYPPSRNRAHPVSAALPIHTACRSWKGGKCQEVGYTVGHVLSSIILGKTNSHFVWRRYQDRLPLHYAIAAGKDWHFIKPLVEMDYRTLLSRDPSTKLFPFQQAALMQARAVSNKDITRDKKLLIEGDGQSNPSQSKTTTDLCEEESINKKVAEEQDLEHTYVIYQLLKAAPDAIGHGALVSASSELEGVMDECDGVESYYLSWLYNWNATRKRWEVDWKRLDMLHLSIKTATIDKGMGSWWKGARDVIWHSYSGEFGPLPFSNKYLLHCALCNPGTPPLLIELLVQLEPSAVLAPFPGTAIYPIHVAAASQSYIPKTFEVYHDRTTLQILINVTPSNLLTDNHAGRSVLEIAIDSGKSYRDCKRLVELDPDALLRQDRTETGLLPFQLMALPRFTEDQYDHVIRNAKKRARVTWMTLSKQQKFHFLETSWKNHHANVLSDIYQVLRSNPLAVKKLVHGNEVRNYGLYVLSKFTSHHIQTVGKCRTAVSERIDNGTINYLSSNSNDSEEFSILQEIQLVHKEGTELHESRRISKDTSFRRCERSVDEYQGKEEPNYNIVNEAPSDDLDLLSYDDHETESDETDSTHLESHEDDFNELGATTETEDELESQCDDQSYYESSIGSTDESDLTVDVCRWKKNAHGPEMIPTSKGSGRQANQTCEPPDANDRWKGLNELLQQAEKQHKQIKSELNLQRKTLDRANQPSTGSCILLKRADEPSTTMISKRQVPSLQPNLGGTAAQIIVCRERWRGLDMLLDQAEQQHHAITLQLQGHRENLKRR